MRVGKTISSEYKSTAGVVCIASMSSVTASPIAREVPLSAVNGVEEYATVDARVGLVVNMVVPDLFRSMVVLLVVPAVAAQRLAPSTRKGSVARCVFATLVTTVPMEPATANLRDCVGTAVHLSDDESIDAIVSPIMVTVVTEENEDETIIPHF